GGGAVAASVESHQPPPRPGYGTPIEHAVPLEIPSIARHSVSENHQRPVAAGRPSQTRAASPAPTFHHSELIPELQPQHPRPRDDLRRYELGGRSEYALVYVGQVLRI